MKPLQTLLLSIALALILFWLTGCAHAPSKRESAPSVAFVSTQKAKLHIEKAKVAAAKITTPEAKRIEESLDMAEEELDHAGAKIIALQDQMQALAEAKEDSDVRALKAENAKRFWRAWTLRLSALSTLLALWIFRKPLLLLCGVPVI